MEKKPDVFLSIFGLMMITVGSAAISLNLPTIALFGSSLVFYSIVGGLTFLIPTGLVAAELSSTWTYDGGIYLWVSKAFGKKMGLLATWYQWVEDIFMFPTFLAIAAGIIAYIISPSLADNKYYIFFSVVILFWAITFLNLTGIHISTKFGIFCSLFGLLIPMIFMIGFGLIWMLFHHSAVLLSFHFHDLIPALNNLDNYMALTGIIFCFTGMEITAVYVRHVRDPLTDYPKALILSVGITLVVEILASLVIAAAVPSGQISLVSGAMQALDVFLHSFHLMWVLPIIGLLIVLGAFGTVNNWIISPTKALLHAIEEVNMMKSFQVLNKKHIPTRLLIFQGVLVTLASLIFLFTSINVACWALTALTAQLYMMMYVMMFAAAIRLRYKYPHKERSYVMPGGTLGLWSICGVGILTSLFTIFIGFRCPSIINNIGNVEYALLIGAGFLIMSFLPFAAFFFSNSGKLRAS
jgi:amino acid transporter